MYLHDSEDCADNNSGEGFKFSRVTDSWPLEWYRVLYIIKVRVHLRRININFKHIEQIIMTEINLKEDQIKQLFKTALIEVIQAQKEVFSDLFAEIIEDIALEKAIKEGENTEPVSREAIFKILANKGWIPSSEKALKMT